MNLAADVERIIDRVLEGIDQDECEHDTGWWETSTGAEFGAKQKAALKDELVALVGTLTRERDIAAGVTEDAIKSCAAHLERAEAAEELVGTLTQENERLERVADNLVIAAEVEEEKRGAAETSLADMRRALEHYNDESNWEDDTPPVEVNTAGYLLFTYVPDQLPWLVARRALAAAGPAPEETSICPECAKGMHVACLDDGSSVWTDRCKCQCGDRVRAALRLVAGPAPEDGKPRRCSRCDGEISSDGRSCACSEPEERT